MAPEDKEEIRKVAYRDDNSAIERFQKGDVTILTISGKYTPKLKSNAMTLVRALRGNVALKLEKVHPVDLSFASFLRSLQQQVQSHGSSFILLRPPTRIVDILNMCYGPDEFTTMSDLTKLIREVQREDAREKPGGGKVMVDTRRKVAGLMREVIKTGEREKSLEVARARLIKMLPQSAPDIPRTEIGFLYAPSDKVGGDVYDFVNLQHGRHGIFIGDVSGHGIEAAVVVGMVKKILDIYSKILIAPKRVLTQSNREIFPDLDSNTFVTAVYGVLDESSLTFTYARAGHPHPLLYNHLAGGPPEALPSKGMSMGFEGGPLFEQMLQEETIELTKGDMLLLYTDGVTEAASPKGAEYGVPRLLETLGSAPGESAAQMVAHIYQTVMDFTEGGPQQDDITLICLKAT